MPDLNNTMKLDVLIVGAGPAGLMAGAWLARTGVKAMIIDQKPFRTQTGHADGIEGRTFEIFDSFGIGEKIWSEANRTIDLCLWGFDEHGRIKRDQVLANSNPGLSRFQESTLGQGRIEQHLIELIQSHGSVEIKWNTTPASMTIHSNKSSHPVEILMRTKTLEKESSKGFTETVVEVKYLIGCDGAHSWVRKQLGLSLQGDHTNESWGVLDSVPITNFPDIRKRCIVKSKVGNLMVIPRERGLVRCYVQLSSEIAEIFKAKHSPQILVDIIQETLYPYHFGTSQVEWSTIYTVGQRLCDKYSMYSRIFLAGDAVHTHSPKAGQGMNVSIQDSYNLGWKLASVIKDRARSKILRTYQQERYIIGQRLVGFDKRMVENFCGDNRQFNNVDHLTRHDALKEALQEENTSASGLTVRYKSSLLVTPGLNLQSSSRRGLGFLLPFSKPHLASKIIVGARFPSAQVLCQSDSRPRHLQQVMQSMGQWHLIVFGGDISDAIQLQRVHRLSAEIAQENGVIHKINQRGNDLVGKVHVYLVHSAPREAVDFMGLPEVFRPLDKVNGYDYWKVFADNCQYSDIEGGAYEFYGIGGEGCIVLLRPDQHVSFVGNLDDLASVETILANICFLD